MYKLWQRYRYSVILLTQLVKTDFKLRYQGSVLGYLWSLLRPLAIFAILYIVFVKFLRIGADIPHFPLYLLLGIVLWNYFAEVTSIGISSVVSRGDLIRKLNFPKYVIVVSASFSALINLALNFIVIAIFMSLTGVDISPSAVIMVPLLIIELFIFALGVSFLLSALFVKFRDINYIWEVVMQAAFYVTPILYPLSIIPVKAAKVLLLNPVAQIIQDMRSLLITPQALTIAHLYDNPYIYLLPTGIVLLVALAGAAYFRKQSKYFAEEV
ncbi:MAG: ABC transporter permease [Candidatus Chaera renei]|uniref:Transport permease protein n=1 Tax=Candidatus Chaera renei TaxID=2506947 RepID=A0A4Q0AJJ9_9BACT|nr:MAG: ABC transporter permease [Candidatus Chaera renei]